MLGIEDDVLPVSWLIGEEPWKDDRGVDDPTDKSRGSSKSFDRAISIKDGVRFHGRTTYVGPYGFATPLGAASILITRSAPVPSHARSNCRIACDSVSWPTQSSLTMLTRFRSLWTLIPAVPLVCALFGLISGYLAVREPKLAVAFLGLGAALVLIARSPISIALLVAPASFNVSRLSIGRGIALPDAVLLIATILSFPALARLGTPRGVTNIRLWFGVYFVAMLAIVVVHPSSRSLVEAGHRTLLVVGPLSVGAWIYLSGRTRLALRLLLAVGAIVGLILFIAGAAHGFRSTASLPLRLNKNYVGSVLGLSILVALAAPRELELKPELRYAAIAAMGGGLVASHSRAAMVALVVGIFVWFFRTHSDYRKRGFIIAAVLAAGFLAYASYSVLGEIANKQATQNTNFGGGAQPHRGRYHCAVANVTSGRCRHLLLHEPGISGNQPCSRGANERRR